MEAQHISDRGRQRLFRLQYYQNLEKAKRDVTELTTRIAQAKEFIAFRKNEWGKVESLQTKAAEVKAKGPELARKKEALAAQVTALESDFKAMMTTAREAMSQGRRSAMDLSFAELKLTDGRVLKDAKVRKVEGRQVSFFHADGIGSVSFDLLPPDVLSNFESNASPLADELAAVESNLFSTGSEQEFDGLVVRCPLALSAKSNKLPVSSPNLTVRIFDGKSPELEVSVGALRHTDRFPLSLAEAADAEMKNITSQQGTSSPYLTSRDVNISGVPGKRASLTVSRSGKTFCVEALYVIRGKQLWFVQTVFTSGATGARSTAEGILSSVKLRAEN